MNLQQFQSLKSNDPTPPQAPFNFENSFLDPTDRTLIYGYTADRESFHVYLQDGVIHRAIYRDHEPGFISHESNNLWLPQSMVPNKRVYPERCDYEFCHLLERLGVTVPYTTYNLQADTERDFHGRVMNHPAPTLSLVR